MKSLRNYINETLLDIDIQNKLNVSTLKKEINSWIKTNMKKELVESK